MRADRDRLGAVNLRAEEELRDTEGRRDELGRERDELIEAIRRLRGAIQSLNREGRERLLAAFTAVNGHFERLFTTLFGGGNRRVDPGRFPTTRWRRASTSWPPPRARSPRP